MRVRVLLLSLWTFIVGGCALGPDYERPPVMQPDSFRMQQGESLEEVSLADLGWWELFQDENLQALIRKALVENKDVRIAVARVREARAQLAATGADQFPRIDGNGSIQRNQPAGAQVRQFGFPGGAFTPPATNQFRATMDLSFELDFWGRLRRATEAAQADLLARESTRRTVVLTLVSDLATAYFELQELDAELEAARRTLKTRQEALDLIRLRKLVGQRSTLDIRRAEQEVARARAVIPDLERQIGQKEHQLSLLMGRNPARILRGVSLRDQPLPPEVPAGLPSALLERRPDIVEAEQKLVAANARIGVAKAAFFPQISLTGNFGAQSLQFSELFVGASRVWQFGPTLTVPLFDAGRNLANLEVSQAQREQAVIAYEKTIQQAFREVEDALLAHQKIREIRTERERTVGLSREAVELAQLEYLNGQASYLEVLTAQREALNAETALAQTQRNHLLAVVQLYKSLGGGWTAQPVSPDLAMREAPE
ncbi:MAG: efflux transporter outer membrane subunit [Nitrospira sp. SB0677_bin_15]|nr:efflux transporter outer membrane subunit [Nitrospira sp. SB0667_bin_9]MYD31681.1 efflux transporter outer membrane subunit [Nitrospira sp. SB0661_bin_20]MYG40356.1 efflux transporter outer membrane subunit [Nitrospira sp. SB0677_bin_15]MYH02454.1 efflux transporter outer membrane subunit [Nitrospira sp. SB0675_bin_23]MYJ23202.1 efflux transporter outer membrane subunit [Nitrospira sp. SB0673_bin_12]